MELLGGGLDKNKYDKYNYKIAKKLKERKKKPM